MVLGAVAPRPLRLAQAETVLKGQKITEELLKKCSRQAPGEALRISQSGRIDSFTKTMITNLVYQALKRAWPAKDPEGGRVKMGDFSIVGTRYGRIDGQDKATGRAKYINDLNFPGNALRQILRSPYPHARICHVDTSRAEKLMGVRAVATVVDTPKKKYGAYRSGVQDELIFAQDKVRYVGDEVAAVAAIDEEIAQEAMSLIRVDYEELPAVFHPEEAMKPGAPQIHDEVENNIVQPRSHLTGGYRQRFSRSGPDPGGPI